MLSREERDSLIIFGEHVNAQFRHEGKLAIRISENAEVDADDAQLLPAYDVKKLEELLAAGRQRGAIRE